MNLEFTLTTLINKYKLNKYFQNINLKKLIYDLLDNCINLMKEYIENNILQLIYYDIYQDAWEYAYNIIYVDYIENKIIEDLYKLSKIESINILYKCSRIANILVFKYFIPKRSYVKSHIRKNYNNESYNLNINNFKLNNQLKLLKSIKQPDQRSDEWYIFRNSTLTASNIYKIFISEYSQNQLIIEKCEPIDINKFKTNNLNSPMHWGQKYEPVSILYYEYINNTKVDEFGCIPHPEYNFIAASPDGIVCDSSSELFGRMLEIKNVVSREISGIPKMEYWIQMQLQMEVCNLNECDFLETKFVEYTDLEEYIEDIDDTKYKGLFLQFLKNDEPVYIYPPFLLNDVYSCEYNTWYQKQLIENKELQFIKTIYWKLEVISCVLVMRNKFWFANILPYIETFWNTLIKEREDGSYKERYSKKRKLKIEHEKLNSDFPKSGCLINL